MIYINITKPITKIKNPEILFFVSSLKEKKLSFSIEVLSFTEDLEVFVCVLGTTVHFDFVVDATVLDFVLFNFTVDTFVFTVGDKVSFCIGFCCTFLGVSAEPLSAHAVNSKLKNSKVVVIFIMYVSSLIVYKVLNSNEYIVNSCLFVIK